MADLFVAGVQEEIGKGPARRRAPFFKFGVEELGAVADLRGTDGRAAEFLDEGGDFAGGDALNIHFGEGEFEGLLGAPTFLEGAGIEAHVAAHLGNVKFDGVAAGW